MSTRKQRTQARGVPWGAPVIRSLRDLDDYEVAELVRKKDRGLRHRHRLRR